MSGLLPRTPEGGQTGSFDNLNVQTLIVSIAGYINALTTNQLSVGTLDAASISTGVINGTPNLDIVATAATVNSDTIVTRTATQTLTNKTLSFPLVSGTIVQTVNTQNPIIIDNTSSTTNNNILIRNSGVDTTAFGCNNTNNTTFVWTYPAWDFRIGTSNLERLRIPAGGIANDNSITNMLGLSGTTLSYKNNVVDTSTAQSLTNKTLTAPIISTISNTGTLTLPTSTDTLVGRATTDSLTNKDFPNGISQFAGKILVSRGTSTTTDGSTISLLTIAIPTNTVASLDIVLDSFCTAGANANTGGSQFLKIKGLNAGGTVTTAIVLNSNQNSFATSLLAVASGTNVLVQITGIASNTINWAAACTTYYM